MWPVDSWNDGTSKNQRLQLKNKSEKPKGIPHPGKCFPWKSLAVAFFTPEVLVVSAAGGVWKGGKLGFPPTWPIQEHRTETSLRLKRGSK